MRLYLQLRELVQMYKLPLEFLCINNDNKNTIRIVFEYDLFPNIVQCYVTVLLIQHGVHQIITPWNLKHRLSQRVRLHPDRLRKHTL